MTLVAQIQDTPGGPVVSVGHSGGCAWWPDRDATLEILFAKDPEAKAVELCETKPELGEWTP